MTVTTNFISYYFEIMSHDSIPFHLYVVFKIIHEIKNHRNKHITSIEGVPVNETDTQKRNFCLLVKWKRFSFVQV